MRRLVMGKDEAMKDYGDVYFNKKITVEDDLCIPDKVIMGSFRFTNGDFASFVCGWNENGSGLDHVSVAPYKKNRIPTWEQMCEVKDVCFNDEEEAYEIHPPKSEYVNMKDNCLHLWARSDGKRVLMGFEGRQ